MAVSTRSLDQIEAVRRFGRFYTQRIGVLEEGLLQSPYPLSAARLLYEIAQHDRTTAGELVDRLGLDPGYVSRLVRQLHEDRVIQKEPSPEDGRVTLLGLTKAGKKAFAKLNAASRDQVDRMLEPLSSADRRSLIDAMVVIERLLGGATTSFDGLPDGVTAPGGASGSDRSFTLRSHRSGDMGWVVQRHGVLYRDEYDWDEQFEALVAEIVARFIQNLDPRRERCWIAERDRRNVGCVFCVRSSEDENVAQLRLLLVEPEARGLGIGKRLVGECTIFARQAGYRSIILWTNSVLDAARHLYEQEGYRLVRKEPHHSFGHDLVGQFWELEL